MPAINKLENKEVPFIVANQVKEKFGTLRFYYQGGDEYIRAIVDFAEKQSSHTCEECGNVGKIRNNGWLKTLCVEHNEKQNSLLVLKDGVIIEALTQQKMKRLIIKSIKGDKIIGKEISEQYDEITKKVIKNESEEDYLIKEIKTDTFSYYDVVKINNK